MGLDTTIDVLVRRYGDAPFPCTFIQRFDTTKVAAFDRERAVGWLTGKVKGPATMASLLPDRLVFEELIESLDSHGWNLLVEGGTNYRIKREA
jgi:hypothetical protein